MFCTGLCSLIPAFVSWLFRSLPSSVKWREEEYHLVRMLWELNEVPRTLPGIQSLFNECSLLSFILDVFKWRWHSAYFEVPIWYCSTKTDWRKFTKLFDQFSWEIIFLQNASNAKCFRSHIFILKYKCLVRNKKLL